MPRNLKSQHSAAKIGIAIAFSLALIGCSATESETPAAENVGAPNAGWGEFSVLIGDDLDLGTAKVSVDGKVLGYLDRSCGLIAAAPSGEHEVVVEWDTARISEVLIVPENEMISVKIDSDLNFVPTAPVKRDPQTCAP